MSTSYDGSLLDYRINHLFSLMSTSSIPMMARLLLLDEFWATSEPKLLGASQHPDEGVCQFGLLILVMSQSSDALSHSHCSLPAIHLKRKIILVFAQYELRPWPPPCQLIPFGPGRGLRGCVTSRSTALLSPRHASWLSHCLLSSSHCAALSSSCRASWLMHCLSPSSRCVTLSSSRCAGLLSHRFSSSSCCAPHSSSRRADWLLSHRLSMRWPLIILSSRCVAGNVSTWESLPPRLGSLERRYLAHPFTPSNGLQ